MAHTLDPIVLTAWRQFLTAHARIVERLSRELEAEAGLPLTWYEVLLILNEAPQHRLRMHELADSLLLSRSAATRFVDRMETAGLVERVPCDSDGRGTNVRLSDLGLRRLRSAAPIHLRGIAEHFGGHIDLSEADALGSLMSRLAIAVRPPGQPVGRVPVR